MTTTTQLKQQVQAAWTAPDAVAAWEACHQEWAACSAEMTRALVGTADPKPGQRILDLATGTGMSAFALAQVVAPDGHVTGTDLSPGLTAAATRIARTDGYPNVTFREADAHQLPFPDATFDQITSRLGAMFFVDEHTAHSEIARVLHPGGRAAHVVWGPPDQDFFRATVGVLGAAVDLPTPPPGAPTPFRYATGGSLTATLQQAGFQDITEQHHHITFRWPGDPASMAAWWIGVAAGPFARLIQALPADQQDDVRHGIEAALTAYQDGATTAVPAQIIVVTGQSA